MSELTPCNYCSLRKIKANAKKNGLLVLHEPHLGGTNIYTYVEGHKVETLKFKAWFMEISNQCCC